MAHAFFDGQLLLAIRALAQRLALDVGHDVTKDAIDTAGVEQGQDERMIDPRGELRSICV